MKTPHSQIRLLLAAVMILAGSAASGRQESASLAKSPSATVKRLEFEVASVRPDKSDAEPAMNVSPVLGDTPAPPGGLYLARNIKLIQFIAFAYSLTQIQLRSVEQQAPWTTDARYDIEARGEGNPTKAQYRQMMQSLLADRFKLAVHYETRKVPVFVLVLAKPGKFGPQMRLHRADDPACAKPESSAPFQADAEGFPASCGGPFGMTPSVPGRMKSGGRGVSMARFAAIETGVGAVDRPMVDQTGITGTVDFYLEWKKVAENSGYGARLEADEAAPTFEEALREQMGIKMLSRKLPSELFFIDHIERPSPD
jgi:uncharacterized protein (TIGR03435 family)